MPRGNLNFCLECITLCIDSLLNGRGSACLSTNRYSTLSYHGIVKHNYFTLCNWSSYLTSYWVCSNSKMGDHYLRFYSFFVHRLGAGIERPFIVNKLESDFELTCVPVLLIEFTRKCVIVQQQNISNTNKPLISIKRWCLFLQWQICQWIIGIQQLL